MKYIALISPIFLTGCLGEFIQSEGGQATVDATATGLSFLGPWGVAAGGLLTAVAGGYKGYAHHKDKKKLVKDLSLDTYHRFKNLSDKDKQVLDADIRAMIPAKYQSYYDKVKELDK
jgi:hypothetical protein